MILIIAAFAAGILNAIAGGGSFLTFPALVFVGIPPVAANATSAVAVFPGYLGAVLGFREELLTLSLSKLLRYGLIATIGGLVGSLLLLVTSNEIFSILIPWLLLFATLLFALGEKLTTILQKTSLTIHCHENILLLIVSIYGGYFNGGLGIILLAVFSLIGMKNLNLMNGLKNGMSFVLSFVSVVTFAVAGIVHWPEAMVMMVASTLGGYCGAIIAKALAVNILKIFIILVGFTMTIVFFFR